MKPTHTKHSLLSGIIILLMFISCSSRQERKPITLTKKEQITQPAPATAKKYYINSATNERIAAIGEENEQLMVMINSKQYFGKLKRADKRKYYDQNNQMQYAVKYSEDGFKLRDKNEKLLWKVKIADNIKIADNEEMTDPLKVSFSGDTKIKLKKEEKELGVLRVNADAPSVTIDDVYQLHGFGRSLALGVMMIRDIPEEQKILIAAELLNKQK